jgi:CO/xanthine dehydrogenase Mo-binding subunit
MKTIGSILICFWLLSTGSSFVQSQTDTCHVYVIDVAATERLREKMDADEFLKKSKQEQEAIVKAAGAKVFEEFATNVGEEELTTKTFPFPKGKQVITASIFYTDESMRSTAGQESMLLGISVAAKATDDALSAPGAAVVEITYDDNTDAVRVKKNVVIDGRLYVVGLECRCKKVEPKEKQ